MSKKAFYWITGTLMVLSLILGIAANYLHQGTEISIWVLLSIFVSKPIFYMGLGAVSAVKLFPKIETDKLRLASLIGGIIFILVFAFIAGCELAGHPVQVLFLQVLRQLFKSPGFFLIPGFLVGLGLFED